MNASNALRQEAYQVIHFQKPATKPALVCVDLVEQNRVLYNLLKEEELAKHSGGKVFAMLKGKLTQKTYFEMLSRGIADLPGLNACVKMQDHAVRLEALQTLEAAFYLFKFYTVSRFEQITPDMLAEQRAIIQANRDRYTAAPEWIASYKAQTALEYEGKAVKKQRNLSFCEALAE